MKCTSDKKKAQTQEVTIYESNEDIKPKRCRRQTTSDTAEKSSIAPELKVVPKKGKKQECNKSISTANLDSPDEHMKEKLKLQQDRCTVYGTTQLL